MTTVGVGVFGRHHGIRAYGRQAVALGDHIQDIGTLCGYRLAQGCGQTSRFLNPGSLSAECSAEGGPIHFLCQRSGSRKPAGFARLRLRLPAFPAPLSAPPAAAVKNSGCYRAAPVGTTGQLAAVLAAALRLLVVLLQFGAMSLNQDPIPQG